MSSSLCPVFILLSTVVGLWQGALPGFTLPTDANRDQHRVSVRSCAATFSVVGVVRDRFRACLNCGWVQCEIWKVLEAMLTISGKTGGDSGGMFPKFHSGFPLVVRPGSRPDALGLPQTLGDQTVGRVHRRRSGARWEL